MLHLELEAPRETPPSGTAAGKSRFLAFGSAALLIAGVAAFQSGTFAAGKPAGAASLIAESEAPEVRQVDGFWDRPSFFPDAHDETMEVTCDSMPASFASVLANAEATLHQSCTPDRCSLGEDAPQETVDALNAAAMGIMEHAWAADHRHCLTETMADDVVREHAHRIQHLWPAVLEGASATPAEGWDGELTLSARERLERSHGFIGEWRTSILTGAGSTLDRSLIFPKNVEDPDHCPEPCTRCTREHNSIFDEDEDLSFKCILPRDGVAPASLDLHCSEPVQRNSLRSQLRGETNTWCDVLSWHASHDQAIALAADVKCGAEAILGPLRHGIEMEERVREACQSVERGRPTEALVAQEYHEFVLVNDGIASPAELAAFRIFMELDQAEAVAAFRRAARGNAPPAAQ